MPRNLAFDREERVEALAWLLHNKSRAIDFISQETGICADDICSRPMAKEGFGDSEMLGFLAIHHGPVERWDKLVYEFRGDWKFYSGFIRGYYTPVFLEWDGSIRRKANYLALGIRQPQHWLGMYVRDETYVSRASPIKLCSKLLFYYLSWKHRNYRKR